MSCLSRGHSVLRWHVHMSRVNFARKIFIELRIFVRKVLRNVPPTILSLYSVGQKKSREIPAKCPTKFPCEKSKKNTDELLQERQENSVQSMWNCIQIKSGRPGSPATRPQKTVHGTLPRPTNHQIPLCVLCLSVFLLPKKSAKK